MPGPERAAHARRRAGDVATIGGAGTARIEAGLAEGRHESRAAEAARALDAGRSAHPSDVLALQGVAGNKAVARSVQRTRPGAGEGIATRPGASHAAAAPGGTPAATRQAPRPVRVTRIHPRRRVGATARRAQAQRAQAQQRATAQRATAQRAPGAPASPAAARTTERNNLVDLLNGFEDLAGAAVNDGGRHLDSVRFGGDLSAAHHRLLERVQTALIQAQESSPAARRSAIAAWPSLDAALREAIAEAGKLGISRDILATVTNNLAALGEMYVHARPRGASRVETPQDFADLFNGLEHLLEVLEEQEVDKRDAVVPLDIAETNAKQRAELGAVQFGGHLTPAHRDLLETLRTAFILARTETTGSPAAALAAWKSAQGALRLALRRMPSFIVDPEDRSTLHRADDVDDLRKKLNGLGESLFVGGVYAEAHNAAVKETNLQAPDLAFQKERLTAAADSFEVATKLAEKGLVLTGENAIDQVLSEGKFEPGLGHAIVELVHNPAEIMEKLEEFQKAGVIGKSVTVAQMAEKILAMRNAVIEVGCEIVKRFAESAAKQAAAAGIEVAAKRWENIAEWAGGKLKAVGAVKEVASKLAIAISVITVIDDLIERKYDKAFQDAGIAAAGYLADVAVAGSKVAATGDIDAGLAAGGVGLAAGIVVGVAAEVEALRGAAAMIEYCEKESVREAVGTFVGVCSTAADVEAKDLVADARLLDDPANAAERELIEQKLLSHARYWLRDIGALSDQVDDTRVVRVGGQPDLLGALGPEALAILRNPGSWAANWQAMAEEIRIIFAGASRMAEWAVKHYPRTRRRRSRRAARSSRERRWAACGGRSGAAESAARATIARAAGGLPTVDSCRETCCSGGCSGGV